MSPTILDAELYDARRARQRRDAAEAARAERGVRISPVDVVRQIEGLETELQRLCAEYKERGVTCSLIYEDATIEAAAVRKHLADYRYRGIAAAIDERATVAREVNATVTPQAVVIDASGAVRYRGRIDNRYVDFGKSRRVVTERDLKDALDAVIAGRAVARAETTPVGCFIANR